MSKPTIYYIRHGQTDWNAAGRFQGSIDIPLNDTGRRQAARAGMILKDILARDGKQAEALPYVASPLGRATLTMELVRGALDLDASGYAIDPRLREIGYGEWEGLTLAEQQARDPGLFQRRLDDKWTLPAPNGESYAEVTARMQEWAEGLTGDTVVVAHGGTARALMVGLGHDQPDDVANRPIEQGVVYVFSDDGLVKVR